MLNSVRRRDIHWGYLGFFISVHLIGAYGIYYALTFASEYTIVFAFAYFFLAHLSITCGAHRLYSHESFEATYALQFLLVLLFSATAQGPVVWWVGKHKHHHAKEDQAGDPHSPRDGFFHSHMGWLIKKSGWATPAPHQYMRHFGRDKGQKYAPALWQTKHYVSLATLMTFVVPAFVCSLWDDMYGGLLVGGFARLVLQYHFTWVVNSAGHMYGERAGAGDSTNLWALAIPTVGESFHGNHHLSPGDFRLGRKWYEIDLGAYTIRLCAFLGLAKNLKTPANTQRV